MRFSAALWPSGAWGSQEAALEQLISLGAIRQASQPTGGRPSTLWSAIPESEFAAAEESQGEPAFEEIADELMQEQT